MAEKYMNPREAIIELNRLKTGVRTPTDFDRRDRAIETAKAALQKDIPKRAVVKDEVYGYEWIIYVYCPTCNEIINDLSTNRCDCGQRLDWSESNDRD